MRRVLVPSVLLALALALPGGAAAAAPRLAGLTALYGPGPASVAVTLPREVAAEGVKLESVEGSGIVTGVVLRAEGAKHETLAVVRPEGGETMRAATAERLPAGRYRLYLLSDGPAVAAIALPGLGGALALLPRDRARTQIVRFERGGPLPADVLTGYSAAATLARPGLALVAFGERGEGRVAGAHELCMYASGEPGGYLPGCAGGTRVGPSPTGAVSLGESGTLSAALLPQLPAGPLSFTAGVTTLGPAPGSAGSVILVPYR